MHGKLAREDEPAGPGATVIRKMVSYAKDERSMATRRALASQLDTTIAHTEELAELVRETREGRHTDLKFGQNLGKAWTRIRTQNDAENH